MSASDLNNRIHLGEPVYIAQAAAGDTQWGHFQFPSITRTLKNNLAVTWYYGNDDIDYVNSPGRRDSADGICWRPADETDRLSYATLMPNGKQFAGFVGQGAYTTDIHLRHTPAAISDDGKSDFKSGYRVFKAADVPEVDSSVSARELDPLTGEITEFPVTLNWPETPLLVTPENKLFPVRMIMALSNGVGELTIDGEMYFAVYFQGFDSAHTGGKTDPRYYNIYVFRSVDSARTWDFVSQVLTPSEQMTLPGQEGYCEPGLTVAPDGTVIMLLRTGSNCPCFITRSADNCRTWSEPTLFDSVGVLPRLLTLKCGVTVATYGRPGLYLRATDDPSARIWAPPIAVPLSAGPEPRSCYYTRLLAIDDNSFWMVYSDFHHIGDDGAEHKAIAIRRIIVDA